MTMTNKIGIAIVALSLSGPSWASESDAVKITARTSDQKQKHELQATEEEIVRDEIDRCLRATLPLAGDLDKFPRHVLRMTLNQDGVITTINTGAPRDADDRYATISSWTAAVFHNPACRKFALQRARHHVWRNLEIEIDPSLLAQRWAQQSHDKCKREGLTISRNQSSCGFALSDEGGIRLDGQTLEDSVVVSFSSNGERVYAKRMLVHAPSPSGRFVFLHACADSLCWAERMVDRRTKKIFPTASSKYGFDWVAWSPDETVAVAGGAYHGHHWITVIHTENGRSEIPKFFHANRGKNAIIFLESFRWEKGRAFSLDVKYCVPSQDATNAADRECALDHRKYPKQRSVVSY